ncbi:MAG: zinc-dependent peptidase [Flavobacteriales bacterium]|nr:zinc-dependent peptidase [Flavobacteriales bacterium]
MAGVLFFGFFFSVLLIFFLKSPTMEFYYNRILYGNDISRGKYKQLDKQLSQYNTYYNKLSLKGKAKFLNRLLVFIKQKKFIGKEGLKIDELVKIVISSAAIQISYGLDDYHFFQYDYIHVYPSIFNLPFNKGKMRGATAAKTSIFFSWKHIKEGFEVEDDNINLGVHEMSHAFMSQFTNQFASDEMKENIKDFFTVSSKEYQILKANGDSILRKYGAATKHEFFPVCIEHFFESPKEFKYELPSIFKQLCVLLNQNPLHYDHDYNITTKGGKYFQYAGTMRRTGFS